VTGVSRRRGGTTNYTKLGIPFTLVDWFSAALRGQ
jgi:hypothetical protein